MRSFLTVLIISLTASTAMAQSYPTSQEHQQMQVSGNYYSGQPYYAPPAPVAQQPAQPAPAQHSTQPQPGEYGYSFKNDIRQMNF